MGRFTEEKIFCQKREKIQTDDEEIVGGYASRLRVSINEMLPGIQNDGQINGQVREYKATFTVNNNVIFGLKDISVKTRTNMGMESPDESPESPDEYEKGKEHAVRVFCKFGFN